MLEILWQTMGLFGRSFHDSVLELKNNSSRKLFLYGLGISILGMLSFFLSEMLLKGVVSPHTVFFQLLAYYTISYILLSIILMSLMIFNHRINIIQFLGLYLLSDLLYVVILPFALITKLYFPFNFFTTVVTVVIGIWIFIVKMKIFIEYYKISYAQIFIMYTLPFLLFIIWIVSTLVTLFNYVVA